MGKWIKRIAGLMAVVCLSFGVGIQAEAASFPDAALDHWAGEEIRYWAEKGVLNGYQNGFFYPEKNITRAEAAKIIAIALGLEEKGDGASFQDVPEQHWAHAYVKLCAQNGIFYGYGEDSFAPERTITRQEAMTALCRAKNYPSFDPEARLQDVTDGHLVAAWAVNPVGTMLEQGILNGYPDGTIRPGAPITRAEFSVLMYRVAIHDGKEDVQEMDSLIQSISWQQDGAVANVQKEYGVYWLFLPAGADVSGMTMDVRFTKGLEGAVLWRGDLGESVDASFDLNKLASRKEDGTYSLTLYAAVNGQVFSRTIRIAQSANIKAVFLSSENPQERGRSYVDAEKGNAVQGEMTCLDRDGSLVYQGMLTQIKSRGNSTFLHYPKKSYQIKLDSKTDLLGNGEKEKTWVLLANYADAAQMRDKLCKDLAADMNMEGVPGCDWVDLYFDGEYRGTYLISEKVSVGGNGLDITDLEAAYEEANGNYGDDVETATGVNQYGNVFSYVTGLVDPADISDGYVLELNNQEGDEHCWFQTTRGYVFNIKIPEDLSQTAACYISEFYQEFEDAVYGTDGIHPATGKAYDEYCDLDSLVRMYLIFTFSHNQDAYVQSTFFYLSEGKLYAGPIWDSDQTFGVGWEEDASAQSGLKWTYLVEKLERIPSFQSAVREYYNGTFRGLALDYTQNTVEAYRENLLGTEAMNHVLWPQYYRWSGLGKTYDSGAAYSDIVKTMQGWMLERIAYMDTKFQ